MSRATQSAVGLVVSRALVGWLAAWRNHLFVCKVQAVVWLQGAGGCLVWLQSAVWSVARLKSALSGEQVRQLSAFAEKNSCISREGGKLAEGRTAPTSVERPTKPRFATKQTAHCDPPNRALRPAKPRLATK